MSIVQNIINMLAGYDVNSKLKELQQSISFLKRGKEELQQSITSLKKEKAVVEGHMKQLEKSITEQKGKNLHLTCQLNACKTNYTKAKRTKEELQTKYTEETARLGSALKAKVDELSLLQLQMKSVLAEKEKQTKQINELNATINQKIKEIECNSETITKLSLEKSNLEEDNVQKEQALQSSIKEKNLLKKEIKEKQELLTNKEVIESEDIRELENQIQTLQEQLAESRNESYNLKSQIEQKTIEMKRIGNTLAETKERLNTLQEELDNAESTIRNKDQEIQSLKATSYQQTEENNPNPPIENEKQSAPKESFQPSLQEEKEEFDVDESTTEELGSGQPQPQKKSNRATTKRGKSAKTKEEQAIDLSEGTIIDFPEITNDSNKNSHRSIEFIYDRCHNIIFAKDFFEGTAEEIARKSRQLAEAVLQGKSDFTCGMCGRPVKIAHRIVHGIESLFFAHAVHVENCAWVPCTTTSKDKMTIDENDIDAGPIEQGKATKPHSRILKEMIFSLLCTPKSEELGISDVKCDAVIRSTVPYMKWRRPDISFKYKERDVVIVMQREKHDLRQIVDRDIFFRLNNHHVIWIFGADSDLSYDYMRGSNYKSTLFDCHRNVFIFDQEAQHWSENEGTLCLKYNWLDENDKWAISHAVTGSNGRIATISDFIFDNEYCKPYIKEANEPYFRLHPDAKKLFIETRKSREQLLKEFEEKWKEEPSYEEALRTMKLRNEKADTFLYMGLWGICYNTTTLIQPIFSEQPKDLFNGFFMVKQDKTAGLVNYYGEVIMDWTSLKCEDLSVDVNNNRVLFLTNGLWGVADFKGNILIRPQFSAVKCWSETAYRVKSNNLWGLQNIENRPITDYIFDNIGDLTTDQAEATLRDENSSWITYKGLLDSNGCVIDSNTRELNNKYIAFEQFEKWGVRTHDGLDIIVHSYESILPWTEDSAKVKYNGKWGVIGLPNGNAIISNIYDSIEELKEGRAKATCGGTTYIIDANGNLQAEKSIILQNGFIKSQIGGKWGIEKDGDEIVPHKYDEIGSFRQRLIGVINSCIIKLNAYYDYPIRITGKCSSVAPGKIKVDISGVSCYLPKPHVKQAGIEGKIIRGSILENIAFSNLIFNQKLYMLRFITDAQILKKMSHSDKDSDFNINEIVIGNITSIVKYKVQSGKTKTTKVRIKVSDGRETMIPKRFFAAAGLDITTFKKDDIIQIQKIGFDDELDQTTWRIKSTTHVNSSDN